MMLEIEAALEIVLRHAARLPAVEGTPVLGRIIAERIASDIDSPPFAKSMMDGYALRSADSKPDAELNVIEEVAAGKMPTRTVQAGQCSRVMTGAPIPDGADAVVPFEEVEATGETIRLRTAVPPKRFVIQRGQEMRKGEDVISYGKRITPAVVALLAAVGRTTVSMYSSPRVAVVSTGDELVEPDKVPGPGQIRNSNGLMLKALAETAGSPTNYLGIASDDPQSLRKLLNDAFDTSDVMLISGGVSAGKFDFVPGVLKELGVETHFHKINMKPGKPLLFGTREGKMIFGLPGNPVSSFVGFELFVRPALRTMAGNGNLFERLKLELREGLKTSNDRPTMLPARWDGYGVWPLKWFGSADLRAMLDVNALIRVPAGEVEIPAGAAVPVYILNH